MRIVRAVLLLSGVLAAIVLAGPVERGFHHLTTPLIVRPEIDGVVTFNGKAASGIQVRAARIGDGALPACDSLPVVAVSGMSGTFRAPAVRKPRILVKNEQIHMMICLTKEKFEVDRLITFFMPNEIRGWRLKCEFPMPRTGQAEDHPCFDIRAN